MFISQFSAEYQIIVKEDEEVRQYGEERNREGFAQIATMPQNLDKKQLINDQ